ncbi:MAG TPA: ABATE domain-containing protein [Thermomicrobiales bacterium]|nr:ABATE domain-containing protein [Thermomicrobiales bacterium]
MDTATTQYYFLAGNHCLDYANTADWHEAEQPVEMLTSYGDLLAWGRQAGVLDSSAAERLLRAAEYEPEAAVAVYERAITFREAVFRIFRLIARHETPSASDLALLNDELRRAGRHRSVAASPEGYEWDWADQDAALDLVLWHVAQSAADLLVEGERERIRQCAGDPCGWLFYDTSRNRSRRWCNMEGCGNRAKARRYYQRRRGQPASGSHD